MARLDVLINPASARAGAAGIVAALGSVTDAAEGAAAAGLSLGSTFGLALGGIQAALALIGGPLSTLTYGVGLLVTELAVGAAVDDWTALAAAMGDLRAITGATGADLQFLTTQARDFGAASIFASEEAARALTLVASARPQLLENFQGLAGVTDQVLLLARAANIDLVQASEAVGGALNQFQLAASDTSRVVNVLAAGAKFGSSEIASTAEALAEAGVVAARANVTFEELNAAIQLLAAGGITGGRAGNALRNVILGLQLSVDQFNPAAQGFTQALQNLSDASLSTADQLQLVGREGITAFQILTGGTEAFRDLTADVTDTNEALQQAEDRFDNLQGDLQELDASSRALGAAFGEYFAGANRLYVQAQTAVADTLSDFIRLDNAVLRRTSTRAEQLVGPPPENTVTVYNELGQAVEQVQFLGGRAFSVLSDSIDGANLAAERLSNSLADTWARSIAGLRAFLAERRGEEEQAEAIRQQLDEEIERRENLFRIQQSLVAADRLFRNEPDPGDQGADRRLAAINAEIVAQREIVRLEEQRQNTIRRGLDPLRGLEGLPLEDQLNAARRVLEDMRTPLDELELSIERIRLLGSAGVFAADPQDNARRTQEAVDFVVQQYEDQQDRLEQAQITAEQRQLDREERAARQRLDVLRREQQQREAIASSLISQYDPLTALERTRAEATERANQSVENGTLAYSNLSAVLQGINEQYEEERNRLDGTTEAARRRQEVINRFLPDDAAFQRYTQAILDIDDAQLSAEQTQRAQTAALDQYHDSLRRTGDTTAGVIRQYLPARAALENYRDALERISEANLNSVETEMAKVEALNEYSRAISTSNDALDDSVENTKTALGRLREEFDMLGASISEGLAGSLLGVEQDFGAFLQRITQRLLAAQLESAVVNPLLGFAQNFVGGLFGGGSNFNYAFGSTGGAQPSLGGGGLQFGGIARPGRSYLVGEAGPEILSQGRGGSVVTPLGNRGGGGNVYVTVQNGSGTEADVQESTTPEGDTVVDVVVGQALGRMGRSGELDSVFRSYGGSRQLISR